MDGRVPGPDGREAGRSLRARGYGVPIVAMTAKARAEGRSAGRDAGMGDHRTKPVSPLALYQTLLRWMPTPAAPAARPSGPLKKRVATAEEKMAKFQGLIARIDEALSDPNAFVREPSKAARLAQQRVEVEKALMDAEEEWLLLAAEQEAAQ